MNVIKSLCLSSLVLFCLACQPNTASQTTIDYTVIQGETMGTYYRVTFGPTAQAVSQAQIDSLLVAINAEVSTYIETATISRFNQANDYLVLTEPNPHFLANFQLAKAVFEQTDGAFEPTVMPLVNYWGFGYTEKRKVMAVDSLRVDSLIRLVDFRQVRLTTGPPDTLYKDRVGVQLDFSACAKGYAVDEIAALLRKHGCQNYLVDIGGEACAKGVNAEGKTWTIGINRPEEAAAFSDVIAAVPLKDRAIATSGNYRNFYEANGVKYGHTINPKTGFPERSQLLSASVFAPDCIRADAYATAFMVMGFGKALALAGQLPDIESYFVYSDEDGELAVVYTPGLRPLLEN